MTGLTETMARSREGWTSDLLKRWYSAAQLEAALLEAMAPEADRIGNLDFGAGFRDAVAEIDVPDPLAWANHHSRLGDGQWCVTGIRYRGQDMNKPFVDVVATSLPPTADALADVVREVLPSYAPFNTKAVRVDVPEPDQLIAQISLHSAFDDATVDQYVVAGLVSELVQAPLKPGFDRIRLVDVDAEDAARACLACYTELATQRPQLAQWAHPATAEELEEAHDQRLLFRIVVDGDPAGIVAANRENDHAMTGFVVQEIVLDQKHVGQRLAAPVQQHLLRRLPGTAADTLWGTIHPDNQPSLRNALSLGRQIVGAYIWLTPVGLPGL